jgi:hypothetical protein
MKLLGIDTNAKTVKGQKKGYRTAITYLAPSDASGVMNTCPAASKGCRVACLFTSGRGRMNPIMQARINKTKFLFNDQEGFLDQLVKELAAHIKSSARKSLIPTTRLNGTSDIDWENYINSETGLNVFESFPDLQFYDYTKRLGRMGNFLRGSLPKNYHLTFSYSENTSGFTVRDILGKGGNVAVVYKDELPELDFGFHKVINGDENDLRFLDGQGVIVGLKYKQTVASEDQWNGFVRDIKTADAVLEIA